MHYAFVMGVLDGAAHLGKKGQALRNGITEPVAGGGDGQAIHVLHNEVGAALCGSARVMQRGDIGMRHERQGLAFGFKAPQYGLTLQPRL